MMERHLSAKRPGLVDLVYTKFGGFYVSEEFRRQQRFLLSLSALTHRRFISALTLLKIYSGLARDGNMIVNSYKSYWSRDIVSQQLRPFFASQRIS